MKKDAKQHTATISNVHSPYTPSSADKASFTYKAQLPGGVQLVATHELESISVDAEDSAKRIQTRVKHTFDFEGGWLMKGVYRMATKGYVQAGLEANTQALKRLVEGKDGV